MKKLLNYFKDKASRRIKDLNNDKDEIKNELLQEKLKELEVEKYGLQESLGISKSNIITSFEESNQIFISSFWV